ncbi:IQ-domain 11 [Raphanus sativus]|uniref:Protein IQ-DOMAIN 11 n=1 Tax=Raphanus sativus TaxID=3726 RepID=A0A6J0MC04_RAPSA|nr:protein IQ-DOMAIN 11 [Raphanus sativus]XP_018469067.1 protein IQ-DOMAIN 11 [Raphanus sativus]XP_018469069.1 protein IQ-DOMAIN 11 [Raphanus sativus]KAJ4911987.1 IQ-domain 11 [Raphanus sativus]
MAKKKGLFTILKRIFISEAHSDKKEKRRKWTFWKLKVKKRLPSITEPPENGTRREVNKEESVSDVGEVSQASCSGQLDSLENLEGSTSLEPPDLVSQYQMFLNKEEEVLAATRIQTAFRGYLARKALRALKGIVKLQAYIRGGAVRRQAVTTLKRLQSVVNIQSQVCGGNHKDYGEWKMFSENLLKARKSNIRRQVSIIEEEEQNPGGWITATITPTYMVATESAKAKSRSPMSSPRVRSRSFDTQLESYSPYKNKLCLTSSVMSEAPSRVRVGISNSRASAYQQRSPGKKGLIDMQ